MTGPAETTNGQVFGHDLSSSRRNGTKGVWPQFAHSRGRRAKGLDRSHVAAHGKEQHMAWYYCLTHLRPEPDEGCANDMRMGPYDSEEHASRAMDIARARNEAWEAQEDD